MRITKPTLIINKDRVIKNIRFMKEKAENASNPVRFRPHFKTHQSAEVGQWFREVGTTSITVSSVEMAHFFSLQGWQDITIAILVNRLEIDSINQLASKENIELNLLVDSQDTVIFLEKELRHPVKIWIKIDTGYHRTGIEWEQKEKILNLIQQINHSSHLQFRGLLTHSGHAYHAITPTTIRDIYTDTVSKLTGLKKFLESNGIKNIELSIGDTPTLSLVEQLYGIDEIRPGNFVYYDVMQLLLGACHEDNLAAAVACPVIAKYPQRNELVIYGGAVHLSKDSVIHNNRPIFGFVAIPQNENNQWGPILEKTVVSSISQEHGVISSTSQILEKVMVGDILMILPIHSCLAADCLNRHY